MWVWVWRWWWWWRVCGWSSSPATSVGAGMVTFAERLCVVPFWEARFVETLTFVTGAAMRTGEGEGFDVNVLQSVPPPNPSSNQHNGSLDSSKNGVHVRAGVGLSGCSGFRSICPRSLRCSFPYRKYNLEFCGSDPVADVSCPAANVWATLSPLVAKGLRSHPRNLSGSVGSSVRTLARSCFYTSSHPFGGPPILRAPT